MSAIAILLVCGCKPATAQSAVPTVAPTLPVVVALHTANATPTPLYTATLTLTPSLTPTFTDTPTLTPSVTPSLTPTLTPSITPTPDSIGLALPSLLPEEIRSSFDTLIASRHYRQVPDDANAQISVKPAATGVFNWVYVPVVPFPTVADNISWAAIQQYWAGNGSALALLTTTGQTPTLVVSQDVLDWLKLKLGNPAAALPIQIVSKEQVSQKIWEKRGSTWSIVPFHRLDPSEKVLTVDSAPIFSTGFRLTGYPLLQTFSLEGEDALVSQTWAALLQQKDFTAINRDPSRLTVLVMTGVTALTRATAYAMETNSIDFPATDILPFLRDSNLVHTSNEVSFTPECPYPNRNPDLLVFCSRDKYFDLLRTINLKVVELTGNHVNDWSHAAMSHSLDLYAEAKIATFGGGSNLETAYIPATFSHNGNKLAFVGCNPVGPQYAWATKDDPGAAPCDDDIIGPTIQDLKAKGFIVIMTIQYQEYYRYDAPKDQVDFFNKYVDFGADLVMGSQAHQPQGFGFAGGRAFIHYGIGNLFFDQMASITTRQMFADKLIFYQGQLISTNLFTGIIEDYARPRPMTADERAVFLKTIFKASGW